MTGADLDALSKEFFDGASRALAAMNIGKPAPNAWFDRLPRLEYERVVRTV